MNMSASPQTRLRTIAVASGKGGVGKTVLTANLAVSLAGGASGTKASVIAADLDLGCGNLNACLGVRRPQGSIDAYLRRRVGSLAEVLTPTEQENLRMICTSYSGAPEMQLAEGTKLRLQHEIRHLEADYVLMDLGAGTSADVLDFFLAADERIVVITPESLSLHNAFVFLKTAVLRFLRRESLKKGFPPQVKTAWEELTKDPERLNVRGMIDQLKKRDRWAAYLLTGLLGDFKIRFVVNMYREAAETSHLKNFHQLLNRYLCLTAHAGYLGMVHFDHGVRRAVQEMKPFLLAYPESRAAQEISQVAQSLSSRLEWDVLAPLHLAMGTHDPADQEAPEQPFPRPALVHFPGLASLSAEEGEAVPAASRVGVSGAGEGGAPSGEIPRVASRIDEDAARGAGRDILQVAERLATNPSS